MFGLANIVTATVSFVLLVAMFVPLERLFPARAGQRILRPHLATDAWFFAGQYLVWSALAIAVLTPVQASIGTQLARALQRFMIPTWTLCIIAVVLGDLLVYAFHRACHAWEPLWKFHAVHHSSEHLDFLAAHREHPLDGLCTQLGQNLPAFALGVPMGWLAGLAVFRGIWGVFIHSNVALPIGPLRFVLGAPDLHHWHHACVARTQHNFANLAPWIDVLFGSYHRPTGEETYSLGLAEAWPKGYFVQLAHPVLVLIRAGVGKIRGDVVQRS